MNPARHLPLLLAGLALLATAAHGVDAKSPPPTDYARVQERIALLLGPRRTPPPPPTAETNPFRTQATAPADPKPAPATAPTAGLETVADVLARLATTVRLGGVMQIRGQAHVTLNGTPCRVGSTLPVRDGPTTYRLTVKDITATHLVFQLGDAELSVRLP